MRIFVYEHLTALNLGIDPSSPDHAMFLEGRAMRDAVADDLRAVPGCDVTVAAGFRRKPLKHEFRAAIPNYDAAVLIAPEWELGRLREWSDRAGVRVLGPTEQAVALTGCKLELGQYWQNAGIPTPAVESYLDWFREPNPFSLPVVVKPVFGAGSTATFLVSDLEAFGGCLAQAEVEGEVMTRLMIQQFVPGRPASVAFLIGPRHTIPLVPTFQHLSDDGRFHYRGGELPIPPDLAERAVKLATQAVSCVPGLLGYVGVDLILGDTPADDFAIEINPRLTTSYIGLRALADFNLAAAMLAVAAGDDPPPMAWRAGRVRFDPAGYARME